MPLTKIENIDQNSSWALWEIKEPLAELLSLSILSTQDREAFNRTGHARKLEELLAGRLSVRALATSMDVPYTGLCKDECDKPYLINSSVHISITHSYPYAAAIMHKLKATGIDLEKPRLKLLKIAHKFLATNELNDANENTDKLCIYWCAKETMYKIYGRQKLLFKENLLVEPFNLQNSGYLKGYIITDHGEDTVPIYYEKFNDYYITYNC